MMSRKGKKVSNMETEDVPLMMDSDCSDDMSSTKTDFETAQKIAGFGKFHYWLLFVCGWANASDAIEILCISFLLPAAQCDLKLTSAEKGWLSAIMFIGMLIGGYLWGGVSDVYGRKKTLIVAMMVNAVCGFASSLSQEKISFFVIRFLSGVGVGGSIPVVWTYFGEFQPPNRRGTMLSLLATFWMVGNVAVAVLAWLVIPRTELGVTSGPFLFNSWRIFVLLCAVPAFAVSVMLLGLPESPKYLIEAGRSTDAVKVLAQVFHVNSGRPQALFPVDQLEEGDEESGSSRQSDEDLSIVATKTTSAIAGLVNNTFALFSRKLWQRTTMMLYINFAIAFGYYGLWLWFPTLFDKLSRYYVEHPNATVSVCQITDYSHPVNASTSNNLKVDPFCGSAPPETSVFTNSIYISLAAAPANLWTIFHMDKLGRKFFLVLSMTLSGLSAFLVYLVRSEMANLLVSILFGLVSTSGFNALDCLGIELFPTTLRGTGMAITLAASRFGAIMGNVLFGYLVESNCAIPLVSVATLLVSGGLLGSLLPNTTKQSLT